MKYKQRGVAAVELALILPLLLAICFATTEFGRAIYTYNTLAKSTRDASRYLSTQASGNATAQGKARNLVVYGNPAGTGSSLMPGLTTAMVDICDPADLPRCASNYSQGSLPVIDTVTVTIKGYQFNPVIDLLIFTRMYTGGSGATTSITFGDISVTMRKQS
ncbi:MAG: pilus assembly protein [Burkholderiales bacterium]|nr:pilus assembly protein [Burkholderiales bacterium]